MGVLYSLLAPPYAKGSELVLRYALPACREGWGEA